MRAEEGRALLQQHVAAGPHSLWPGDAEDASRQRATHPTHAPTEAPRTSRPSLLSPSRHGRRHCDPQGWCGAAASLGRPCHHGLRGHRHWQVWCLPTSHRPAPTSPRVRGGPARPRDKSVSSFRAYPHARRTLVPGILAHEWGLIQPERTHVWGLQTSIRALCDPGVTRRLPETPAPWPLDVYPRPPCPARPICFTNVGNPLAPFTR